MRSIEDLLRGNRLWVEEGKARDPHFFDRLAAAQRPSHLWIGCSDSRVPANEIVNQPPGEIFVHRNVANIVAHADLNCLSVIQYALEALGIEHIIVCGHYGCGGVKAVIDNESYGLIDNWLRHVHDVRRMHYEKLENLDREARFDRLCELNVIEQVRNVASTSVVQRAWREGRKVFVHGWIYSLKDGLLKDLGLTVGNRDSVDSEYERAFS